MLVRITATAVVLSMIRRWLGRGGRGNLLLWLGLLILDRWGRFCRGLLRGRRGCCNRSSPRPRGDEMRSSRLGIVTRIGNNFADLLNLLSLNFPNDTYTTTFLLLWFILSLLRRTPDRRRCLNGTNWLGRGRNQRTPSGANVLANTNLYALISHSARELCRLWGWGEKISG